MSLPCETHHDTDAKIALTTRWILVLLCIIAAGVARGEWRGVDLSYVNELEDCGADFRSDAEPADPYRLFADAGANLVRLRLWVDPDWTEYSTLDDVMRSMERAHAAGLAVMLDFHYSDDWAHPGQQLRPAGWPPARDVEALTRRMYDYTRETLQTLEGTVGLPAIVAVGNETNTELLLDEEVAEDMAIDWQRNSRLLNAGISAVRDVAAESGVAMEVMLHIAQPENVASWFDEALVHGVVDFDVIGISYYPKWSHIPVTELEATLRGLRDRFERPLMVVETAYPWTLEGRDAANNILGGDSLIPGYPASAEGQGAFLRDLRASVRAAGGEGVVYWEPAWVTSNCETRWGRGSHWENATLLDFEHRLLPGAYELLSPATP